MTQSERRAFLWSVLETNDTVFNGCVEKLSRAHGFGKKYRAITNAKNMRECINTNDLLSDVIKASAKRYLDLRDLDLGFALEVDCFEVD